MPLRSWVSTITSPARKSSAAAGNSIDDDDDWVEEEHDTNGNGRPDPGEFNVDEPDEGKIRERDLSLFPIIPTFGFTWEF